MYILQRPFSPCCVVFLLFVVTPPIRMSKFRVRAVFGSVVKPIELSRNNYSFNEVRDEVRVKHELRDFQLRYVSPSLGDLFIQDNDSFHRVVKDAELRGVPYVEIRVVSHERAPPTGKGGATPTQSYNSYTPSYSSPSPYASAPSPSPNYGAPQQNYAQSPARYVASPPPAAARASSPSNVIATFVVQGDRGSTADRLSLKANQENDHFAFVPIPAKCNSDVTIVLEASKLTCESVTNHPDGRSIKFTQAFNLPFVPAPNNIQLQGQILRIYF
jgi:hypothetical protein